MKSTCEILRTPKEWQSGRLVETGPPAAAATHPCRIRSPRGDEAVVAGQVSQTVEGTLLLPFGVEVRGDDQLRVGGEAGVVYEAVAVLPREPAYAAHEKVLISKTGGS